MTIEKRIHPILLRSAAKRRFMIVLLIAGLLLVGCAPATQNYRKGVWHTIKPGENLEAISDKYGVDEKKIQRANDIYDPEDLSPGMRIFIPTIVQKIRVPEYQKKEPENRRVIFAWPSPGTISSGFGIRRGRMHHGIDITRDRGLDIRAAGSGIVEFAGVQNGYGKTIIINHGYGYQTLYAHNAKLYVKKGMRVKRGVVISKMGATGKSVGIHLHFEVRYRGKPQNPLRYLPVR